jgi:hypothetical protein
VVVAVAVFLLAHRGRRVAITAALAATWPPLERTCASAVATPKPGRSTSPFCSQNVNAWRARSARKVALGLWPASGRDVAALV